MDQLKDSLNPLNAETNLLLSKFRNLTKRNYAYLLDSGQIYLLISKLRELFDSGAIVMDSEYKLTLGIQLKFFLDYLESGVADLDNFDPFEKLKIEVQYIISKLDLNIDLNDITERKKGNRPNRIKKGQFP